MRHLRLDARAVEAVDTEQLERAREEGTRPVEAGRVVEVRQDVDLEQVHVELRVEQHVEPEQVEAAPRVAESARRVQRVPDALGAAGEHLRGCEGT